MARGSEGDEDVLRVHHGERARTTYVGVTNDLERRVWQHRNGSSLSSFSAKHGITKLVYIEDFSDIHEAIAREKQIKNWRRSKKVALINAENPGWDDLAGDWYVEKLVQRGSAAN
ncbi:MAG: GIY-YIG nuclease family protein [Thermomicrobiales bacterium]